MVSQYDVQKLLLLLLLLPVPFTARSGSVF
jgi:hypothetical protein